MRAGGAGADSFVVVGTCDEMCPLAERQRREETGELNELEMLDPENRKVRGKGWGELMLESENRKVRGRGGGGVGASFGGAQK